MSPVLELVGLSAGYDRVPVVRDLDLVVGEGEVVALLGPNGAGKTTTLLTVSGLGPGAGGDGDVRRRPGGPGRKPHRLAREGMAHVPDDRGLFPGLTVAEHLDLGGGRRGTRAGPVAGSWVGSRQLEPLLDRRVGLLSGGEQQMLALAQALLREPRLLMVDEMSLGLAPIVVESLLPIVRRIAE